MLLASPPNIANASSSFSDASIPRNGIRARALVWRLSKRLSLRWAGELVFTPSLEKGVASGSLCAVLTMTNNRVILLVEDNEDDVRIMKRALKEAQVSNPLFVVEDGQQALDYLAGQGKFSDRSQWPMPALVFLDLKLPL